MPEVLGNAAVLESLGNPESFAAAILKVLSDEKFRQSMKIAGIRRAQHFHYEASARQLLKVFADCLKGCGSFSAVELPQESSV